MLGVIRTTPLKIPRALATAYVELFRNIPLLVQMFLWYFVMPELVPESIGNWLKTEYPNLITLPFAQFSLWEFTAAVLCLVSWNLSCLGIGFTHSFIEHAGQVDSVLASRSCLKPQPFRRQRCR